MMVRTHHERTNCIEQLAIDKLENRNLESESINYECAAVLEQNRWIHYMTNAPEKKE
jgi:hypothetical protein